MSELKELFGKLQPLGREYNPSIAAALGFLFGGIGLAIYLKSFIDFIVPILLAVLITCFAGDLGWFIGSCCASAWGYFRVVSSNETLSSRPWSDRQ